MGSRFIACSACARHVRESECFCPFCGAKAPCVKPLRRIAGGLSRTAMQAAGAAGVVVGLGDCSSSSQPLYGGVCVDSCTGVTVDAGDDAQDSAFDGNDSTVEGSTDSSGGETSSPVPEASPDANVDGTAVDGGGD